MAKGEFQKYDTSFLSSFQLGQRPTEMTQTVQGPWNGRTDTLLNTTENIRPQGVGVKVIMTGEFIPNESQDCRYGCQQKNVGGILTPHLNST